MTIPMISGMTQARPRYSESTILRRHRITKLSQQDEDEIVKAYELGEKIKKIAERFNTSGGTIYRILHVDAQKRRSHHIQPNRRKTQARLDEYKPEKNEDVKLTIPKIDITQAAQEDWLW